MKGGSLIKEARLRAGYTQAQLAERLGTAQSVVARWETRRTSPSFETVVRAIRACGLELTVSIANYDHEMDLWVAEAERRTPSQRLQLLRDTLETERVLRRAKRVGASGQEGA